eukprot:1135786_1
MEDGNVDHRYVYDSNYCAPSKSRIDAPSSSLQLLHRMLLRADAPSISPTDAPAVVNVIQEIHACRCEQFMDADAMKKIKAKVEQFMDADANNSWMPMRFKNVTHVTV